MSTSAPAPAAALSPPQVAERYGIDPAKVIGWIRSGELRALNLARRGSKRPRYRILPADLLVFEQRRAVGPAVAVTRRRRKDPAVIEFF